MRTHKDHNKAIDHAQANADYTGKSWGVFKDTNGNTCIEVVNKTAAYSYSAICTPRKKKP